MDFALMPHYGSQAVSNPPTRRGLGVDERLPAIGLGLAQGRTGLERSDFVRWPDTVVAPRFASTSGS
jgi:hypothetical protein